MPEGLGELVRKGENLENPSERTQRRGKLNGPRGVPNRIIKEKPPLRTTSFARIKKKKGGAKPREKGGKTIL